MGALTQKRHNVTVGLNDTVYYVDYTKMDVYEHKTTHEIVTAADDKYIKHPDNYQYKQDLTQLKFDNFKSAFIKAMQAQFPSLKAVDKTVRGVHYLLENNMFQIGFEDNDWSVAVELIQKKCKNPGLQANLYPSFSTGMRDILITQVGEIHLRTGSWTTDTIDKQKATQMDAEAKAKAANLISPSGATTPSI